MPMYEYRCQSCGARTEHLLAHSELTATRICEACDGQMKRVWSRVGVKLSGWGFSSTDAMVADRPGRGDFKEIAERAERLSD